MGKNKLGILVTSLSAVGLGSMSIFAKIAYSYGVNVMTLLIMRYVLASLFFIILIMIFKKPIKINKKIFLLLIFIGFLDGIVSNLFFYGVALIPASLAGLILYIYPTIVCILAYFLKEEELNFQKIIALLLSVIGLVLIMGPAFHSSNIIGTLAVFLAAFIFALYIVILNRILRKVHWLPCSTIVSIAAAVYFIVIGIFIEEINLYLPFQVYACAVIIALFSTVLALGGLYAGISMIGPTKASIVSSLEPMVTIFLAAIIFAERLNAAQSVGACLIILSIVYLQITKS
jgi:drug/metabolite transporter (DMT)-like permease